MTVGRTRNPLRSPLAWVLLLGAFAIGLGSDLAMKWWAFETLELERIITADDRVLIRSDSREVIPNVLTLKLTANQGAVFGLGQRKRELFVVVSLFAVGFLLYLFAHSGGRRVYQVVLGLLLAGVLGNLYDRITLGWVRDMFWAFPDVEWKDLHASLPGTDVFPWIFNIADALLCCGVAFMLAYSFLIADHPAADQEPLATDQEPSDKDPEPAAS